MNNIIKQYVSLLIAAVFFFLLLLIDKKNTAEPNDIIRASENILHEKEKTVKQQLSYFQEHLKTKNSKEIFELHEEKYINLFNEEGIVYLVYNNDSLIYWSDNSASVEEYMKEVCLDNTVAKLKNGYYEVIKQTAGKNKNYTLYGLILIKHQFSYQNNFLKNTFFKKYIIPEGTEVSEVNRVGGYSLKNSEGTPLLYLYFNELNYKISALLNWLYFICFLISLLSFFVFIKNSIWKLNQTATIKIIAFSACISVIRIIMMHFRIPGQLYASELYNPLLFGNAASFLFGYIGDILINGILLCWLSFLFKKESKTISFKQKSFEIIFVVFLLTISIIYLFLIQQLIKSIVINSSITLQITQLFQLNLMSYVAFIAVILMFISFYILITIPVNIISKYNLNQKKITYLFLVIASFIFMYLMPSVYDIGISWLVFLLIFLIYSKIKSTADTFLNSIILALLFSIIISYEFYVFNHEKEIALKKTIAEKIAERDDAVAENLFSEIRKNLTEDKALNDLLTTYPIASQEIEKRIRQVYLGGYWERYQVNFNVFDTLCRPLISVNNPLFENNSYFDELIKNDGITTASDDFYFLNKQGEDIKYIGKIELNKNKIKNEKSVLLYFEFSPRNENQPSGFPELLLDQTNMPDKNINELSYAIYKNNQLLSFNGIIDYPKQLFTDSSTDPGTFQELMLNKTNHLIYKHDNEIAVVISDDKNKFTEWFTSNSYFFFLISLFVWIIYLNKEWQPFKLTNKSTSIRLRIQLLIVSIVLFFLISLGYATFIFVENQFKNKNTSALLDKLNLAENAIKSVIQEQTVLNPAKHDYIGWQLKKASTINLTDIHLFDVKGNLYASSQPRLFNEGIISKKMNPEAYRQLKKDSLRNILIKDNIGNMNFYSVFRPLQNNNGQLIAYINLPYFAKQTDLEKEWNLYIVAIVNIYVVLFSLSTVASLLISNIVTKPLQLIQDKFSSIKIGKHNEPIIWNSNDEIGSLIVEYNKMIDQLEQNVIQLAKSEREGAWKEMAKQVAHEIKNPLTPMKLSIQHLERSLDVDQDELKNRIRKLSKLLIEQIDSLALIANEFSSFAKMPAPDLKTYSIHELIKNAVQLFSANDTITLKYLPLDNVEINAKIDKDQFCRVLYNLLKNAQQAIPSDRIGEISIELQKLNNEAIISITDNGVGIAEELKDKIFYPNFSTKTEGMGLGLAMSKNIIESFNGTIYFETSEKTGTTFYIKLPVV
jgi:signal transduction histidine kinase